MWPYTLLHVLIAILPMAALQIWLVRPDRVRYAPIFIAGSCAVSMILSMLVAQQATLHGFDLRLTPYLIGSLYGGIPGASVMTVLYIAARLSQLTDLVPIAILGGFLVLFVPLLFSKIAPFQEASRNGRMKIAMQLSGVLVLFTIAIVAEAIAGHPSSSIWLYIGGAVLHTALCLAATALSVRFIELAFERLRSQAETERRAARHANEASAFQAILDLSPLVVAFIDGEGRIARLNEPAAKLLFPASPSETAKPHYREALPPLGQESLAASVDKALRGEESAPEMIRLRNRVLYTTIHAWQSAAALEPAGALLIAQDMTEQQRLKDEVDKMERLSLVGQMAASITHEIRNPMAVIRGFVQLLNERSPKELQSYYHIILQELDRANGIINDFLSLAQNRIVDKKMSDLHAVLEDIVPLIWADANMRGQMIDLRLCDTMEPLELNVREIKQMVLNLARNGMEAMDDKGVLRIETLNLEDTIQLRVSDTGVGIPPEKLERLFEPFYTTKANGTGLGLALCLSIVERHNGKINVESRLGHGTTFIVSFCKPGCECWQRE